MARLSVSSFSMSMTRKLESSHTLDYDIGTMFTSASSAAKIVKLLPHLESTVQNRQASVPASVFAPTLTNVTSTSHLYTSQPNPISPQSCCFNTLIWMRTAFV